MSEIDFLNKRLNIEELSEFLTELMNYAALPYEYPTRIPMAIILDEEGDEINYEKYIGNKDIHIVRNVLLLKEKLDEERGYSNGMCYIRNSINEILGIH
jgi:hypothetical protein